MLSFGSLLIITYIAYGHLCIDRLMGTLMYIKLALSGLMPLCQILSYSREGSCTVADRYNKLLQQLQFCLPLIFLHAVGRSTASDLEDAKSLADREHEGDCAEEVHKNFFDD